MRDLCPYNVNCHLQLKHPNTPDRNLRDDRDQRSQGKDTKDSGRREENHKIPKKRPRMGDSMALSDPKIFFQLY